MKYQKGFSLIELGVTVGLMGAVSLLTMKIMENQSATQLSIEATAEINTTVSLVAQAINDPIKCNQMFSGSPVNTSLNGLSYLVPPDKTMHVLQTRAAGKIYRYFYLDNGDIRLSQNPSKPGMLTLDITFNVQSTALSQKMHLMEKTNARTVRRQIPFNAVTSGTNVVSCGPVVSFSNQKARENACKSLEMSTIFVWNTTTSRCEISPKNCGFGLVPVGFNASGVICQPASSYIKVEDIFDLGHVINCAPPSGGRMTDAWGIKVSPSGKLRLSCTRLFTY